MRLANNIRKSFKELHVPTSAKLDEQINVEISTALEKAGSNKSACPVPNIWKIIMKSRITKLAAAALIIIATILIFHQFGGSVSLATIAFADITDAMKSESWVHIKNSFFSASVTGPREMWVSFESKITAAKMTNGQVTVINLNEHKSYTYDPNSRSITIDYVYENDFPEKFSSAISIIQSLNQQLESQGAQTTIRQAEYNGEMVLLQESAISKNNSDHSVSMYIKPDSKLLLCTQVKTTDSEGNSKIVGEITFDYPQSGPVDIYALNVPRDAEIVNNLPEKEYMDLWDNYQRMRKEATQEYLTIVTHTYTDSLIGDITNMIDVDYKSGQNHRFERHFVSKTGQSYDTFWPEYKKQLGDSYDSLLVWTQAHYKDSGYISIYFFDGQYNYSTKREDNNWSDVKKTYAEVTSGMPNSTLEDIGWPIIGKSGHIIEDDYAKQNNLICIERLQQGDIYQDIVSLPARILFYLDPQKDYLCVRKVTECRPDADWQEDKNWLEGIELEKIRKGSITIEDVTNDKQAENGHWYPQTVEIKQTGIREDYEKAPLKISSTKKIYLNTNPNFPEGIFDAEKLQR